MVKSHTVREGIMGMTIKAYEEAVEALQARLEDLFMVTHNMTGRHISAIRAEEAARPGWENKSNLMPTCKRVGNSLRIEWMTYKWYGRKGERRLWRETLKKPKGEDSYNLGKLLALAKDWEKPLVEKLEPELARIRHEARLINKAIMYLRHARNVANGDVSVSSGMDIGQDTE
jgi:hypothetical protein